jgi:hypothetical protein
MTNDELRPYADKILEYLYEQEDQEQYYDTRTIFELLGLDKKLISQVLDLLWYETPKKIDAQAGLNNAQIRLSKAGRQYIEDRKPINISSIKNTCELIFQHLKEKGKIHWYSGTYNLFPRDANEATKLMERQCVIYTETTGTIPSRTTRLEPDIMEASSYKEALSILENKRKPVPAFSGIYAPNNKGNVAQSSGNESPTTQSVTTTPNKKHNAPKINWYNKPLFTHFIWPLLVGLILIAITIFLAMKYGLKS